jgi:hypothetical protein
VDGGYQQLGTRKGGELFTPALLLMIIAREQRDESCEESSFTYYDDDYYCATSLLQDVRLNSSMAGYWRGKDLGCLL